MTFDKNHYKREFERLLRTKGEEKFFITTKIYTERRVKEIFENARKLISKFSVILEI